MCELRVCLEGHLVVLAEQKTDSINYYPEGKRKKQFRRQFNCFFKNSDTNFHNVYFHVGSQCKYFDMTKTLFFCPREYLYNDR